jgi:aryl-alcohol dehydrogenase-like predicted oxidoreductase
MGMSEFYGSTDDDESIATIRHALDRGINFLDTADIYGMGRNEELVGKAIAGRRDEVFLATKFGIVRNPNDPTARGVSGKPDYIRACCEASLKRLNVESIDLYYQHRVDPDVPIEETIGAMSELIREGKVKYLGLSEASAQTLQRAVTVHSIAALQSEYSLFSRDIEDNGVLDTIRLLGIALVPYSPLGRGFLSGNIRSIEDLAPDDFRRHSPRFQGENFAKNLVLVEKVTEIAHDLNVTPSQIALAWVLAQGSDVIPIPGTKRRTYLDENIAATEIRLNSSQLAAIAAAAPKGTVAGDRYADMSMVNR